MRQHNCKQLQSGGKPDPELAFLLRKPRACAGLMSLANSVHSVTPLRVLIEDG